MTTVRYVGDIHGEYGQFYQTIQSVQNTVQVGDYGIGFGPVPVGLDTLNRKPDTNHRFIRGNHDSPSECAKLPYWIEDGRIETVGGYKIMYIGGAYSIDKDYRIEGVSWWPDEELSYPRLIDMIVKYQRETPDIMITHECPDSVADLMMAMRGWKKLDFPSRTRTVFDQMLEIHRPNLWIFGHWHLDFDQMIDGTRFMCLNCHHFVDVDYSRFDVGKISYWNPFTNEPMSAK